MIADNRGQLASRLLVCRPGHRERWRTQTSYGAGWIALQTLSMLMIALVAGSAAAVEPDFTYCTTCHGSQGNGNPAIRAPKIAGVEPWYLTRQLQAFRAGIRGQHPGDTAGQEMQPVGERLKDDSIITKAVAFVGTLDAKPPPVTVAGDEGRGKSLYASCTACHGAKGEGSEALNSPALANRTDWYLVRQLENYKNGLRGADLKDTIGAPMRAVAATLPDHQAMLDVVAYINTLR